MRERGGSVRSTALIAGTARAQLTCGQMHPAWAGRPAVSPRDQCVKARSRFSKSALATGRKPETALLKRDSAAGG